MCGHKLDAATRLEEDDAVPKPGDLTVCIQCVAPLTFTEDMRYRFVDADAFIELPDDARIDLTRYMRAIHTMKEKKDEFQTNDRSTR